MIRLIAVKSFVTPSHQSDPPLNSEGIILRHAVNCCSINEMFLSTKILFCALYTLIIYTYILLVISTLHYKKPVYKNAVNMLGMWVQSSWRIGDKQCSVKTSDNSLLLYEILILLCIIWYNDKIMCIETVTDIVEFMFLCPWGFCNEFLFFLARHNHHLLYNKK